MCIQWQRMRSRAEGNQRSNLACTPTLRGKRLSRVGDETRRVKTETLLPLEFAFLRASVFPREILFSGLIAPKTPST